MFNAIVRLNSLMQSELVVVPIPPHPNPSAVLNVGMPMGVHSLLHGARALSLNSFCGGGALRLFRSSCDFARLSPTDAAGTLFASVRPMQFQPATMRELHDAPVSAAICWLVPCAVTVRGSDAKIAAAVHAWRASEEARRSADPLCGTETAEDARARLKLGVFVVKDVYTAVLTAGFEVGVLKQFPQYPCVMLTEGLNEEEFFLSCLRLSQSETLRAVVHEIVHVTQTHSAGGGGACFYA